MARGALARALRPIPPCPACGSRLKRHHFRPSKLTTLEATGTLKVPVFLCPRRCPGVAYVPPLREVFRPPHRTVGYDLVLATTFLRYSLNLDLETTATNLRAFGFSFSLNTLSRLAAEGLVRWGMLCEERLSSWVEERPWRVLLIDGTVVKNGPTTFRAIDAGTETTLLSRQIVAEDLDSVLAFLTEVRCLYGDPDLILHDLSRTLRTACWLVFWGCPQQEDHWHFLQDLGPKLLVHYLPLKEALEKDHGLSNLVHWSRTLPVRGKGAHDLEGWERVWVRLALEYIEEPRTHKGGYPWHLPYLEVARRARWVLEQTGFLINGNVRRRIHVAEVVRLKEELTRLLGREGVRTDLPRVESEAVLWEAVRAAMKLERDRRSRTPVGPLTRADVETAKRSIEEARARFRGNGDWAVGVDERVGRYFEAHEEWLWVASEVVGLERMRVTVDMERSWRGNRMDVRRRTGQGDTGPEMGRLGALLAMWDNLENPWLVEHAFGGMDLVAEFASQDAKEVRRRLGAIPKEGRRVVLPVKMAKRKRLEELVALVRGEEPLEKGLGAWGRSVGLEEDSPVAVST